MACNTQAFEGAAASNLLSNLSGNWSALEHISFLADQMVAW